MVSTKYFFFNIGLDGAAARQPPFLECANDTLYLQNSLLNVKRIVCIYQTTWHYASEYCSLENHRRDYQILCKLDPRLVAQNVVCNTVLCAVKSSVCFEWNCERYDYLKH